MSDTNNNLAGLLSFIQYKRPPLEAGEYQFSIEQRIEEGNKTLSKTYQIAVLGPRYALRPSDIRKVFPPAESVGEYANVLPHVVFNRPTFPWERTTETPKETAKIRAEAANVLGHPPDYKPRQSWLALLAFDQDEVALPHKETAGKVQVAQGTVKDLFDPPEGVFSYFSYSRVLNPALSIHDVLDYGESESDACMLLDIPFDLFHQVAPSGSDLQWLAHARELDLPDGASESTFSVVMGNRLARPGEMTTVHLVSLEGLANFLPGEGGEKSDSFKSPLRETYETIRLVSLHSWQYAAVQEKITFGQLLENLNSGKKQQDGTRSHGDSLLRRPVSNPSGNTLLKNAMERGFSALSYFPRSGTPTLAWYRGPFAPEPPAIALSYAAGPSGSGALCLPSRSADDLIFFDPEKGLLDISYATAWQTGRLLALANREFSTGFYRWTNQLVGEAVRLAKPLLPSPTQRQSYYKQMVDKLADPPTVRSLWPEGVAGQEGNPSPFEMPENLRSWLSDLVRLRGVPFHYLVPDAEMLPVESIRFFRVDENWLKCLVDGALSVGRSTVNAEAIGKAFAPEFYQQACQPVLDAQKKKWTEASDRLKALYHKAKQTVSPDEFKKEVDLTVTEKVDFGQLSGFLLRSDVVRGWWPGILADGYKKGNKVANIRSGQLSGGVMIHLFGDLVDQATIHEPPEGLHFGFDFTVDSSNEQVIHLSKSLRALDGDQPGSFLREGANIRSVPANQIHLRQGERNVLLIDHLFQEIQKALGNPQHFTAAEFALEMVQGVQLVAFNLTKDPLA